MDSRDFETVKLGMVRIEDLKKLKLEISMLSISAQRGWHDKPTKTVIFGGQWAGHGGNANDESLRRSMEAADAKVRNAVQVALDVAIRDIMESLKTLGVKFE
jgi:hypothetical protein